MGGLIELRKAGRVILASFYFVLVFASTSRLQEGAGLRSGDTLDQNNWQKAEGLLPPGILDHYKNGEWATTVIEHPKKVRLGGQDFREGTEKNRGKFTYRTWEPSSRRPPGNNKGGHGFLRLPLDGKSPKSRPRGREHC